MFAKWLWDSQGHSDILYLLLGVQIAMWDHSQDIKYTQPHGKIILHFSAVMKSWTDDVVICDRIKNWKH